MKKTIVIIIAIILVVILAFGAWWVFIAKKNIPWFDFSKKPGSAISFELKPVSSDSAGINPTTSFILKSSQSVSEDTIKKIIKFVPEISFEVKKTAKPISFISTVFAEDSNGGGEASFEIKPKESLKENEVYNIIISDLEQADREYSWAFQVKASFQVIQTFPGNQGISVPVNSGVEITFNREEPINPQNYFEIFPSVSGTFEQRGDTVIFLPKQLLDNTIYTVTIKKGLKAKGSDDVLENDYVFAFETGQKEYTGQKPYFDFQSDFLESVPGTKPIVGVFYQSFDPSNLDISVYRLSGIDDFFKSYQDSRKWQFSWAQHLSEEGSSFRPGDTQKVFSFKPSVKEINYSKFIELPQTLEDGYYVLDTVVEGKHKQVWLQITPISHYFSITYGKSLLWIYDFQKRSPISALEAFYSDKESSNKSSLGKTNDEGLVEFATPAVLQEENKDNLNPRFFRLEKSGYFPVLIKIDNSNAYKYNQFASKGDLYWDFLSTDRYVYQISDTLRYWGVVKGRQDDLRQKKVSVGLFSNSGYCYNCGIASPEETPLVSQEILISQFDTIQGELPFRGVSPGYYTLKVKIGNDIISTASVEILSYAKPAYQIIVTPSKNSIFAGEKVDFSVKSEFFDGTPVSGLKLKYNAYWNSKSIDGRISLNENGEGTFSYVPAYFENLKDNSGGWPKSFSISFSPELSEEGEISANGQVLVFGPGIYLQTIQEKGDNGYKLTAKLNRVVISRKTEGDDSSYSVSPIEYIGDPVVNYSLSADIIKEKTTKVEGGEYYDPIDKVVRKAYKYETTTDSIEKLSGITDDKGEWSFVKDFPSEEGVNYNVVFSGNDEGGRKIESTSYVYTFSKYEDTRKLIVSLNLGKTPEEAQFSIGDKVGLEVKVQKGDKPAFPKILFYRYQNSIEKISIVEGYSFEEIFNKEFLPSVNYRAVIFGPDGFEETESVTASFKEKDRNLTIDISPEKEKYRPGEEVKADLLVKNKKDKPVIADVNVAIVDEALFHILPYNFQAKIIDTLYNNIYTLPITGASQYSTSKSVPGGGAEMGGCFANGTLILMGDRSQKPIEKINIGDQILTFGSENNRSLFPAIVQGISKHYVDEYLVINNSLKVTPEHKLYINGKWDYAGNAKIGDSLVGSDGLAEKISSLERKYDKEFPVYNIVVGKYHTYLAQGYFVHNAEKGGKARMDFVDVVLFQTVKSDKDGKASIKFIAPDNITSWRTTAIAFSSETMEAGQNVKLIKTSLPFFVDVTSSNFYLLEDKPVLRLRAFGTDYKQGDPVEFGIKSVSLNIDKKETSKTGTASIELGGLLEGEHEIVFSAKQGAMQDSVSRKITVVKSYFKKSESSMYQLSDNLSGIEGNKNGFTELLFADAGRGKFYQTLQNYAYIDGIRVDQMVANFFGKKLLSQYFSESFSEENLDLSGYHTSEGGISLFPYSDSDLELSSKMADLAPDLIFQSQLKKYFNSALKDKKSDIHRISKALYGLASLKDPVLVKINSIKENKELVFEDKVYLALALSKIGDKEGARKIYENEIKNKIRFQGQEAWLDQEQDITKRVKLTGMVGVLCSYLGFGADTKSIWNYISSHNPERDLDILEKELLIKSELEKPASEKAKFSFKAGSKNGSISLEKGKTHTINLSQEEINSLKFSDIEGDIGLISFYERSKNPEELLKNSELSLTRKYIANGTFTNSFKEGDVILVRLDPNIAESAIDGSYQVVDYLPSGLRPITRIYEKGLASDNECNPVWYPARIIDNVIYFNIYKEFDKTKNCNNRTINYYARVVSKGNYKANPAVIQSLKDVNSLNVSSIGNVEIK